MGEKSKKIAAPETSSLKHDRERFFRFVTTETFGPKHEGERTLGHATWGKRLKTFENELQLKHWDLKLMGKN